MESAGVAGFRESIKEQSLLAGYAVRPALVTKMNLNDIKLAGYIREIKNSVIGLDELTAQGKILALGYVLAKIEDAARQAQWRLLELDQ